MSALRLVCTSHKIVPTNSEGAVCEVCDTSFGWYCPESPNHYCTYENNDCCEPSCDYCGAPEERL